MAAALPQEAEAATISSLLNAAKACENGVQRVHIIDGLQNDGLLEELFSNEGVGTMIYADDYQQIRAAKMADVPVIMSMISQSIAADELIPRSRKEIRASLHDYFLMETDGNPVGIVAVHSYPEHRAAELACLFIRTSHENAGYGRKLVSFAEKRAKERGAERMFALSTQAWRYFEQKCGFTECSKDELPPLRRQKLEASGRNSRVMSKRLT